MRLSKRAKIGLMVLGLSAISAVSGCTTTKYVAVEPECQAPADPVLPSLDKGNIYDVMGDAEYRKIETYINRLWAYSDQQAAIIKTLCEDQ